MLHQGYFTDTDLVAGYDREFKAGASIGHSRALSLENELDVLEERRMRTGCTRRSRASSARLAGGRC